VPALQSQCGFARDPVVSSLTVAVNFACRQRSDTSVVFLTVFIFIHQVAALVLIKFCGAPSILQAVQWSGLLV